MTISILSKLNILVVLSCLAGCSSVDPFLSSDPNVSAVWPPKPSLPRVRFVRLINGPGDIVAPKGKLSKMFEFLAGGDDQQVSFGTPYGVATDEKSVLYVADPSAGLVHRYDLQTRAVSYISRAGEDHLESPVGVALDADGKLLISDSLNAKVYNFDRGGDLIGELKPPDGFKRPAGIAVNGLGEKYVVDVVANTLLVFDKDNRFIGKFPKIKEGNELSYPSNVAIDSHLNVYITDSMNFMVRVYDHEGNFIRNLGRIGDTPGSFARPKGVALDSDDNIYVVDAGNDNFQIFDQSGRLLLFVGQNGSSPGEFYLPSGIYIDRKDRIFIADTYNRRIQIFQYLKEGVAP